MGIVMITFAPVTLDGWEITAIQLTLARRVQLDLNVNIIIATTMGIVLIIFAPHVTLDGWEITAIQLTLVRMAVHCYRTVHAIARCVQLDLNVNIIIATTMGIVLITFAPVTQD